MSHLHLLLLLLLLLAEETSLTIVLGDGQRGPVKRPGTVRKRSARCDAFERDRRSRIEDLPGERVRQVRGKGSDGQDRHLDRVVYLLLVGRHALVLSPDRRDSQLDLAVFKSRLQQVPVFDPNDGRPWISAKNASQSDGRLCVDDEDGLLGNADVNLFSVDELCTRLDEAGRVVDGADVTALVFCSDGPDDQSPSDQSVPLPLGS